MDLFIFGGCISRDAIEFDLNKRINLIEYVARSSLPSALSEPIDLDVNFDNIKSAFQRKCVINDVEKNFLNLIHKNNFDFFLMDLFSNRFDLAFRETDHGNKSYLTLSNEIIRSGFDIKKNNLLVVKKNTDEYIDIWKKSFDYFIGNSGLDKKKIIINKVFLAHNLEDGTDFGTVFDQKKVNTYNHYLNECYKHIGKHLDSAQFIEYDNSLFVGSKSHKWGQSPYHFIDNLYMETIKKIYKMI